MEHVFVCPVIRLKFYAGQNRDARQRWFGGRESGDDEAVAGAWEHYRKREVPHSTGLRQRFLKFFINIFQPL
jgi:hypothetical protein